MGDVALAIDDVVASSSFISNLRWLGVIPLPEGRDMCSLECVYSYLTSDENLEIDGSAKMCEKKMRITIES